MSSDARYCPHCLADIGECNLPVRTAGHLDPYGNHVVSDNWVSCPQCEEEICCNTGISTARCYAENLLLTEDEIAAEEAKADAANGVANSARS